MNPVETQRLGRRAIATAMAAVLVVSPVTLRAGDLNAEVNNMFNSLGTIGNYTAPGAFRGQTFNTSPGAACSCGRQTRSINWLPSSFPAPRPAAAA
jgi:conjugative transfer pilus assembly protein TraH